MIQVFYGLSAKYRKSILGFFWSFLNPLLIILTMSFVFSNLFDKPFLDFFQTVSAGMIPWLIFSNCMTVGSRSLISNESVLRKLYVPKYLFPLSTCLTIFVEYFLIIIFFIFFVSALNNFSFSYLSLVLFLFIYFIFVFSLTLIFSIITVFFRDLENIITALIQVLFFLTPILYDKTSLIKEAKFLILLNPLTYYVDLFKYPFLNHSFASINAFFIPLTISLASLIVSFIIYKLYEKKVVFNL